MAGTTTSSQLRWVWRVGGGLMLAVGWLFILAQNNFRITPPVVFVCLGYFAALAAIATLFRTGAAAVASDTEDDAAGDWGRPLGARGELEREKRALLKAIKEAEFDQEMGKLSAKDAGEMIAVYRARAIEVIKELDAVDGGAATVREQIAAEVRARLELERNRAAAGGKKKSKKAAKQPAAVVAAPVVAAPVVAAPVVAAPVVNDDDNDSDDDDDDDDATDDAASDDPPAVIAERAKAPSKEATP